MTRAASLGAGMDAAGLFGVISGDEWRLIFSHLSLEECAAVTASCAHMRTLFGDARETMEHVCREHVVRRMAETSPAALEALADGLFGAERRPWRAVCMLMRAFGEERTGALQQILRGDGSALFVQLPNCYEAIKETALCSGDRAPDGRGGGVWEYLWSGQVVDIRLARSGKAFVAFGSGSKSRRMRFGGAGRFGERDCAATRFVFRPRSSGAGAIQWDCWTEKLFEEKAAVTPSDVDDFRSRAAIGARLLEEHDLGGLVASNVRLLIARSPEAAGDGDGDDCLALRWAARASPSSGMHLWRGRLTLPPMPTGDAWSEFQRRFVHADLLIDSSAPGPSERPDVQMLRRRKYLHSLYSVHGYETIKVSVHTGRTRSLLDDDAEDDLRAMRCLTAPADCWLRGTKLTGDVNVVRGAR